MIAAIAQRPDGRPIVMIGVDQRTVENIVGDQPLQINLAALPVQGQPNLPDIDVVVFFVDDEAEARAALAEHAIVRRS